MSKAGERIIDGMKEAVAIAKGEQPAASIHMNGHDYVPKAEIDRLREALEAVINAEWQPGKAGLIARAARAKEGQ